MKAGILGFICLLCVCSLSVEAQQPGWVDWHFQTDPGANSFVFAIDHASDGKIYIAGAFWEVNGVSKSYVARLLSDGTLDTAYTCTVNGMVFDLIVLPDDTVVIAGDFSNVSGVAVNGMAKLLENGQYDPSFALGSGPDGFVYNIALTPDNQIIAVGTFNNISGISRPHIARINTLGTVDTSFPSDEPNSFIWEVAADSAGKIYIGGDFSTVGGVNRPGLAMLESDGSLNTTFNPFGLDVGPDIIAPNPNGGVYIGGTFTQVEYTNVNRIARLNAYGNLDNSFITGTGADQDVSSIAVQKDGKLIMGGDFTTYNGNNTPYCIRLNGSGEIDTNFYYVGNAGAPVEDIDILPGGGILVAGQFTNYGARAAGYYCRLMGDQSVLNDFDGDGYTDIAVFYAMTGDWYLRSSVNGHLLDGAAINWGWASAIPATGDFDGDGITDISVFDINNGNWYIRPSMAPASMMFTNFGWQGTIPVVGNYDGDSRHDIAVYDRHTGNWYIKYTRDNSVEIVNWGWAGAMPVPADYDGDRITDIAVYYPITGTWYIRHSGGWALEKNWGWPDAQPVPYDYDRDGKDDIAVYHAATGKWYISYYSGESQEVDWGSSSSIPVAGLYNGSNFRNFTTFTPSTGVWSVWPSYTTATWGWIASWPVWLQFWINDQYGFWSKG